MAGALRVEFVLTGGDANSLVPHVIAELEDDFVETVELGAQPVNEVVTPQRLRKIKKPPQRRKGAKKAQS